MRLLHEMILAISFLTILPVPTIPFQPGLLGQSGRWFPLVGLVIGVLVTGANRLLGEIFPSLLVATLTVALWAILTGGLHLDGLADCCDGLLAPVSIERRMEILRDPRTGAFAVIGLVLFLLLKVAAVEALAGPQVVVALLFAPTWARWLLLWMARQPTARNGGLGAEFSDHLTNRALLIAAIVPLLVGGGLFSWTLLLAAVGSVGVTWMLYRLARNRLGGTTGDVYGLTVEVSELTILLVLASAL